MSGCIFRANQSFSIVWEGRPLVVEAGSTAREGHPLVEAYPKFFDKLNPDFEYTPPPPRPRQDVPKPVNRVTPKPVQAKVESGE